MKRNILLVILTCMLLSAAHAGDIVDMALSKEFREGLTICLGVDRAEDLQKIYEKRKHVVHALSADMTVAEELRAQLSERGVYGKVSVSTYGKKALPFPDNTANLLIVSNYANLQSEGLTVSELFRILAPYGTLVVKTSKDEVAKLLGSSAEITAVDDCLVVEKKYPETMDHWKQDFHDVARSRRSNDQMIGPPTGVRWISMDDMYEQRQKLYSYNGRFAYVDAKSIGGAGGVRLLTVRDAFSGIKLWEKVIGGPIMMDKDLIYTLDNKTKKFVSLDARNGNIHKQYDFGKELVDQWSRAANYGDITIYNNMFILKNGHEARSVETGELLWKTKYADLKEAKFSAWMVLGKNQSSCVIGDGRIFTIVNQNRLLCLDAKDGTVKWEQEVEKKTVLGIYHQKTLFTIKDKTIYTAYAMEDGEIAWSYKLKKRPNKNILFVPKDNVVYIGWREQKVFWITRCDVLDLATGRILETKEYDFSAIKNCFDKVSTDKYSLGGRFSLTSLEGGETEQFYAAMGECGSSSLLFANGLIYLAFSRICGCYTHINKASAFSSDVLADKIQAVERDRLFKGPDYDKVKSTESALQNDWPTYRRDNKRSSFSPVSIKDNWKKRWALSLDGKVSAPVVSGGTVYVTVPSKFKVVAINANTGAKKWEYVTGGKVDSPPTLYKGLALFGCRDGQVYCLNADTGELVWRFMAARGLNLVQAEEGIESLWPVPGSVLVEDGIAYFAAGRHTHSDGGLEVYALECATGDIVWQKTLDGLYEDPGVVARSAAHSKKGGWVKRAYDADHPAFRTQKNDILLSDGTSLYLFNQQVDLKTGELIHKIDDNVMFGGGMGLLAESSTPPFGQKHGRKAWRFKGYRANMLATDGKRMVGSVIYYDRIGDEYRAYRGVDLYKAAIFYNHKIFGVRDVDAVVELKPGKGGGKQVETPAVHWSKSISMDTVPRSFILTKERAVVTTISHPNINKKGHFVIRSGGGALDGVSPDDSKLMILSADDGRIISEMSVNGIPSHDGMALADNKLFMTTISGEVICFE